MTIRLAHPAFDRDDLESLWPILESGRLVQGDRVRQFEAACAARLGVEVAVAVSSGTAALHLAMLAAGVGPEWTVVVPAFTWPAAANVAEQLGAAVRPVDIERSTLNLNTEQARVAIASSRAAGRRVAAIPVHLFGCPLAAAQLAELDEADVVIEDAACAFGAFDDSSTPPVASGTRSPLGCYSFHARKGLTTGEGGLVVCRDDSDIARIRLLRDGGLMRGAEPHFSEPGLNLRLNELAAALGLAQLSRFEAALAHRRRLVNRYRQLLRDCDLFLPNVPRGHSCQSFVVGLPVRVDRRDVRRSLSAAGIEAGVGTYALHIQPYYRDKYGLSPGDFPESLWAHDQLLALPVHEQMPDSDVSVVAVALKRALVSG